MRHAGDALLQERIDPGQQRAHVPVRLPDVGSEPVRDEGHERQHRERHQREPPVHPHQHGHDAGKRDQIAAHRYDAGREQLVQCVDIRRDSRHQTAHGIAIEEPDVQPLQMLINLHPQVEHDLLPRHLHRPGLQILERKRRQQYGEIHRRDLRETTDVSRRDVAIEHQLCQEWRRELDDRVADDGGAGKDDVAAVRSQVSEQTPHQPRVVGLSENVFLVHHLRHEASSSSSSNCRRCRLAYRPFRRTRSA